MNELPDSASWRVTFEVKRTGLSPSVPVTMISSGLILPLGQVSAQQNLLRPRRDVGEFLRVDARGTDSRELDLEVTQRGRGHLVQERERDGLRTLFAGDAIHGTAAERSDGLEDGRFETAAGRDRVEGPRFPVIKPMETLGERDGIGVAGGDDAIADIDDVRPRLHELHCRGKGAVEIGPAERDALLQNVANGREMLRCRRDRFLENPVAVHVAHGHVDGVFRRQRIEQSR